MNLIDVLSWVHTEAKEDDLNQITQAVKMRQNLNVYKFKAGDPVKFDGGRGRGWQHGTFVKLLQKNAEVIVGGVRWRVSPHLLQSDKPILTAPASQAKA